MKIVIAGGTGFLGKPLVAALASRGHEVVALSRRPDATGRTISWNPDGDVGPWATEVDGADAVINLAGAGIADRRWNTARKDLLRSSRISSTRSLVAAVRAAARKPTVFIQGSAVGFYGLADDEVFDESFPPGEDFLGQMSMAWEAESRPVETLGVRLVILRTGIALAKDGGALKKLVPPFQWFVGGPISPGRQYFSWIHRDDWIALVLWALETTSVSGPINATAPEPVTNAEFSAALGRALHRPNWLPVPQFALRLIVGELADHGLITGQRVVPARAQALGFRFQYAGIDGALQAAVGR